VEAFEHRAFEYSGDICNPVRRSYCRKLEVEAILILFITSSILQMKGSVEPAYGNDGLWSDGYAIPQWSQKESLTSVA